MPINTRAMIAKSRAVFVAIALIGWPSSALSSLIVHNPGGIVDEMEVEGFGTANCTNPGGHAVPGQSLVFDVFASSAGSGTVELPIPTTADCPNDNWTVTDLFLSLNFRVRVGAQEFSFACQYTDGTFSCF